MILVGIKNLNYHFAVLDSVNQTVNPNWQSEAKSKRLKVLFGP